ncbi:MAG: hypothetical protein BJ554DRAFT_7839 [Olpidium bornovanus]|uniref:Cysteine and glycine-rich protein n=1 Tax=Olpidium bornovanus TaxID=278681 RepID=A0A8H8DIZ2_9FUNG|nr:MAG: hypothetical protein BJ554DRAFT_7839 [Olpidium bornovanus]
MNFLILKRRLGPRKRGARRVRGGQEGRRWRRASEARRSARGARPACILYGILDTVEGLDAFNLLENNREAYCKKCHSQLFGPKGYGFGGGVLQRETVTDTQPVSAAASAPSSGGPHGSSVSSAGSAGVNPQPAPTPPTTSGQATASRSEVNLATEYYQRISPASQRKWNPSVGHGGDVCPTCNKTVYAAEAVQGVGKKFHKLCFKCTSCNRQLDSSNITEKDNKAYCRSCYARDFGPKGYGYGGGAAFLTTDGSTR